MRKIMVIIVLVMCIGCEDDENIKMERSAPMVEVRGGL